MTQDRSAPRPTPAPPGSGGVSPVPGPPPDGAQPRSEAVAGPAAQASGRSLPRGVRIGVDVGTVRVGVARSDPDGLLATPERTVAHVPGRHTDVAEVRALADELDAAVVYVGLPRTLRGGESESARRAREFADALTTGRGSGGTRRRELEVRLVDERLTTVDASRMLHDSGRRARAQRQVIDQAAAVLILQVALDQERATGRRAGGAVPGADPTGDTAGDGPAGAPARGATAAPDHAAPPRRRKPRHPGR